MEVVSECRCCLSKGIHKDLYTSYTNCNEKEYYPDMLQECFNIVLSCSEYYPHSICDVCIQAVQSSLSFKKQVLRVEEKLRSRLHNAEDDDRQLQVKLEVKRDSADENDYITDTDGNHLEVKRELKHDSDADSDDYYLIDAVGDEPIHLVKSKTSQSSLKKKVEAKKTKPVVKKSHNTDNTWRADKIKTIVNRLTTSMNSCDSPDMKTKKEIKTRKITIEPVSKINLMWTRTTHDKIKHKENLQTILKYSNATPFKNKSLLGFICGYCEAAYPDPADLRTHTEIDHKKERLEFKSSFDMTEYSVKLNVADLMCTLCDAKMDNLGALKEHLVKIHDKTFHNDIKDHILQFKLKKGDCFDCAMCSSTYETFKMLKQHMNKHYSNYICSKCGTAFATKRSLNAHRTTHQEGSFKCDHCDKVFATRSKKCYHEKMKHLGARNISNCPYCNEPFRSYYQRNQHLVKVHNNEAQYKCNVCNKAYILKSLLMYHIKKSHLMERNCQCTECGFRFFSKKALKAHMVKHTGERIYACEVCKKSYARKYTLREHMRIHNNDRRFKCDVCGLTFVQKCSLKSHLLSNHGISVAASDITSS
ncbi:hypothetical protein O3G_MSEX011859 [Manduca sexta]|uniref:Uncharacterized protein n=1 Tax=Manduca sexta TaxID=7130 RepID=A0A921ZNR4_MANSE|nr:hypothetical protein O3G_MSEX011859 [Manduca sexta]